MVQFALAFAQLVVCLPAFLAFLLGDLVCCDALALVSLVRFFALTLVHLPAFLAFLLGDLAADVALALALVSSVRFFAFTLVRCAIGISGRHVAILLYTVEDAASTIELTEMLRVASSVATRMNQSSWIDSTPP